MEQKEADEKKERKTNQKAKLVKKKEKAQEKSAAKKEELSAQKERAQEVLGKLEEARSEGRDRHDERIQKLEGEIREALKISPESWISKDNSLDELIKKLEARHEISGEVQERQSLDEGMLLQKVSGGRALQGILFTTELKDQLEDRSRLLEVPENVLITGAAQAEDKILEFSKKICIKRQWMFLDMVLQYLRVFLWVVFPLVWVSPKVIEAKTKRHAKKT